MSFDIVMQSSHSGGTAEVVNPFTGEKMLTEVSGPINDNERAAVAAVLHEHAAVEADEYGFYRPVFDDGSSVEANFEGLDGDPKFTEGMIHMHGMTDAVAEFIFKIADAGNFVMHPSMDGSPQIVTNPLTADKVSQRMPQVLIATCTEDLEAILSSGVEDWDKYRREVS